MVVDVEILHHEVQRVRTVLPDEVRGLHTVVVGIAIALDRERILIGIAEDIESVPNSHSHLHRFFDAMGLRI